MQALVCRAPGELVLEERPTPRPEAGEALVRPLRAGVCGTDYHIFQGKHPFLNYPRVIGHELAVEVLEAPVGSAVRAGEVCAVNPYLSCGNCIACCAGKPNCCTRIAVLGVHKDGGMATAFCLPAQNLIASHGLGADACASVEFLAIGAHAVRRGGARPGLRALVIGAGPIGIGVGLFASLSGASVTVMDIDLSRLEVTGALFGAASLPAGEGVDDRARDMTGGDGFDLVFDATGNAQSMQRGFDFVAHGGTYVLVSVVKGPISFEDPDFHRKEMSLVGSRNATGEDFERVMAAIRSGQVPVERLITHRTRLSDAPRDIAAWAVEKRGLIKAMVEIAS